MNYYVVSKIGTGVDGDEFRPNVPAGISYVSGISSDGTSFLVATSVAIPNYTAVTDLQGTCNSLGIPYANVITWSSS